MSIATNAAINAALNGALKGRMKRNAAMQTLVAVTVAAFVVVVSGCGGDVQDCQKLAAEQAGCMPASAVAACEQENEQCKDGGEVLVLESCPLQFSCDPPGTG